MRLPFGTIILETERLLLRALTPTVHLNLFASFSDDEIMEFFQFPSKVELLIERQKYQKGLTTHDKSYVYFQVIEKNSGKLIGMCGFHTWYLAHARAEIGYGLHGDQWKQKGYMKEAIVPIIEYGFRDMELNRIEAFIGSDNEASLRLVKGLGFSPEGHLREHYFKNGRIEDSLVFSLLKREYEALRGGDTPKA